MGRPPKSHTIDYEFIAKKTNTTIGAVQKAASRGEFDFDNLESLLYYIEGKLLLNRANIIAREKTGDISDDQL